MTRRFPLMRALALLAVIAAGPAAAQSAYSPAIKVNDDVVTYYELDQRAKLLEAFNTPGDLRSVAREQLIEERLKAQELQRRGLSLSDESLQQQMREFAGRTDLPYEQFLQLLARNGVSEESFRDFVRVGVSWRDYIRSRFRSEAEPTERDVQLTADTQGGQNSSREVLLNEIIIPAPPERAAEARRIAERISRVRSSSEFQAAARQYSALPSRERGGALDWLPVSNYPGPIQELLLSLSPGEVTQPISIPNGVALFQLRDVRAVTTAAPAPAEIDYAEFYISGGRSEEALRIASRIDADVDTCDDLYGEAQGLPREQLQRQSLPPAQIPQDVAMELAKLDSGESSYTLTRNGGQTLVLLTLCDRVAAEEPDTEAVASSIQSSQLEGRAEVLIAELRAKADIQDLQ